MSKVLPMNQGAIEIERSQEFVRIAKELGDHIKRLNLLAEDNDKLVSLMIDQVQEAEATAFRQGFRLGVDVERKERTIICIFNSKFITQPL